MKKINKKFKKAVSLFLAVMLVCAVLPFSASALTDEFVYGGLWIGEEAFSGNPNEIYPEHMQLGEYDTTTPIIEQEDVMSCLNYPGGDIVGWKLWGIKYSTPETDESCEKIADLKADFSFANYTDDQFNALIDGYDEWFLEPVIEYKYFFETNPTSDYPYAKLNKTGGNVQWYKYTPQITTKEVVENVTDDATQVQYDTVWEGTYNDAGYWESYERLADPNNPEDTDEYTIDMAVALKEGDVVTIIVSDGFDGDVHRYFDDEVFTKNGNVYTYESDEEQSFNFYIHNATAAFTAEIFVDLVDYDVTPISGQNKEMYTGEGNQQVACHASFENGKYTIKTEMVELGDSWITAQPTADVPTIETNKSADSYQWYAYKTVINKYTYVKEVTDSKTQLAFDDIDFSQINAEEELVGKNVLLVGEYDTDGYWKVGDYSNIIYASSSPDLAFAAYLAFNKGDKFKVDIKGSASTDPANPDYELQIMAMGRYNLWNTDDFEKDADGNYIVPDDAMVFAIGVMTANADIKVKITRITEEENLTAIDGQTSKTFTGESGTYLVKATYSDGTVLKSDVIKYEKKVTPAPGGQGTGTEIPDTGDNTSIIFWFMTAIFSLAVLAGMTVYRKRTEK